MCTTVFDTMFIRDHRKRVSELIEKGHKIESEPCRGECGKNHNSNIYKRRLTGHQTQQNAPGQEIGPCCPSYVIFTIHDRDCHANPKNQPKAPIQQNTPQANALF